MKRTAFLVANCFVTLLLALLVRAQSSTTASMSTHLGEVNFATSCAAGASELVETGVALLHSFQYTESHDAFIQAAKEDPSCAMAHWGLAMSRDQLLWEFPDKQTLQQGLEDVQQAQKLSASTLSENKITERERGYITAVAAFYREDPKLTREQRIRAYLAVLDQLRKQYPDDVNAAAFYALTLYALTDYEKGGDKKGADTKEAITILQSLCEKAPNNPGPAHYLIHAADSPEFAEQGLRAARAYAKIAPDSSHALHMPSHIFVRLGLWQESIDSNIAAAAAAEKAINEHRGEAQYEFHALDFLHYSYLQSGHEAKAREVLEQVRRVPGAVHEATEDHFGYMSARTALELHRWKDAATLSIPDVRPAYQESTYRVRAIGAARSGDAKAARKNLRKYEQLYGVLRKELSQKGGGQQKGKSVGELEAEAWVQYAEGKSYKALKTMRAAADKQGDDLDSLEVPAREMLGDLLLELKRPADALAEYQTSLKDSPNRFDSVYGAAQSAQLANRAADARTYFTKLIEICTPSADRPELAEAKSFGVITSK
jgi:hypothetical protein